MRAPIHQPTAPPIVRPTNERSCFIYSSVGLGEGYDTSTLLKSRAGIPHRAQVRFPQVSLPSAPSDGESSLPLRSVFSKSLQIFPRDSNSTLRLNVIASRREPV